jgi:hypothetical protein
MCGHSKVIVVRYRVDSTPFAVGEVETSVSKMSVVAASPREKNKKHNYLNYARAEISQIGLNLV